MRHLRLILAVAGVAALACSGDDSPSSPTDGGGASTVSVGPGGSLSFSPAAITVPVNTTVTWNWSSGGVVHNVTFPDDGTMSGNKSSGSFQRTFAAAGTFSYLCTLHGGMSGTVTVTGSSGGSGGTGGGGSGGGGGGAYP